MTELNKLLIEADEYSKNCNHRNISLSSFCYALVKHEQFINLLEQKGIRSDDFLFAYLRTQLKARKKLENKISVKKLENSAEVQNVINVSNRFISKHSRSSSKVRILPYIYFLMNEYPAHSSSKFINDYGLFTEDIRDEIARLAHDLDIEVYAYPPENTSSSYRYILPKGSSSNLAKFTTCLNDMAHDKKFAPTIGRDNEVNQVMRILRRKNKSNPVLLGEAGVGKTAIVEGIAQKIISGEISDEKKIFSLDLTKLVASTMWRGDFEKRLKGVIAELKNIKGSVLFVDELHMLMGAGGGGGSMDAANILKPALARGEISCIGATTIREHKKYIKRDPALDRRFGVVNVREPSPQDTIKILSGLKQSYEIFHGCKIPDHTIKAVVDLSCRYIPHSRLPDKAIDILDAAGALIRELPYSSQKMSKDGIIPELTEDLVRKAVADRTGIPIENLTLSEKSSLLSLKDKLNKLVLGQEHAVNEVVDAYVRSKAKMNDPNKPLGSFIFTGPTGVGKTELVKQLEKVLSMPLVRIDMSEYMDRFSVSGLIGASPGFVGYEDGGRLTDPVSKNGHSIILLDEIEKAHPDVFNILLQVLDDGHLTDAQGTKVNFKNTIIIMTSNIGSKNSITPLGFDTKNKKQSKNTDRIKTSKKELAKFFQPEFINRVDAHIEFNSLEPQHIKTMVTKILSEYVKKAEDQNVRLNVLPEVQDWLAKSGFDEKMGARPLKRLFERAVKTPIAYMVLEKQNDKDSLNIKVSVDNERNELKFSVNSSEESKHESPSSQEKYHHLGQRRNEM